MGRYTPRGPFYAWYTEPLQRPGKECIGSTSTVSVLQMALWDANSSFKTSTPCLGSVGCKQHLQTPYIPFWTFLGRKLCLTNIYSISCTSVGRKQCLYELIHLHWHAWQGVYGFVKRGLYPTDAQYIWYSSVLRLVCIGLPSILWFQQMGGKACRDSKVLFIFAKIRQEYVSQGTVLSCKDTKLSIGAEVAIWIT